MEKKWKVMSPMVFYSWIFVTALFWFITAWLTTFWVPSDHAQGNAQRIFYYHVPTAWVSFLGFAFSMYYSALYLKKRDLYYDSMAASYATIGWVFTTGVIITGPLWAKPIWGDFWNWSDQRLVSFFVLWLAYAGYILLRNGIADPYKKARFSSILGIVAFLDVPLVYLAIRIWNTPSHPGAVIGGGKKSGMDPAMGITFLTAMIAFTLLFFLLVHLYFHLIQSEHFMHEKNSNKLHSEG